MFIMQRQETFYHLCDGEFLIYPFRFRILLGCNFALSLGIST